MGPPSAPDIRGKDHWTAVRLMINWFFANFGDPAESTPWDEGTYIFIWGGPYCAHEEPEDALGATATERALTAAIDQIEQEGGPQWAPSSHRMRPKQSAI
jgi:hypothetical protein